MKTVLAGLIALFAFFVWNPNPAYAACGLWNAATNRCTGGGAEGGYRCTSSPTRCCLPQSECTTVGSESVTPQPGTGQPASGAQPGSTGQAADICNFVTDPTQKRECQTCFQSGSTWTAVGCVSSEPTVFIGKFLSIGIGVAGGIAFLLILFGGFQILTSVGNPEQLNAGRELVGSAVTGLLLIIFSIFLLRIIGVDILGIPGFK